MAQDAPLNSFMQAEVTAGKQIAKALDAVIVGLFALVLILSALVGGSVGFTLGKKKAILEMKKAMYNLGRPIPGAMERLEAYEKLGR